MSSKPAQPVFYSLTAPLWTAVPTRVLSAPNLLKQVVASLSHQAAHLIRFPGYVQNGPQSELQKLLHTFWKQKLSPEEKATSIQKIARTPNGYPFLQAYLQEKNLQEAETLALIEALTQHSECNGITDFRQLNKHFWAKKNYQQALILAVGQSRHPEASAFLKEVYQQAHQQPELRQTAIRALGQDGSAEAVAILVHIYRLHSAEAKMQRTVIRALGYSQSAASARILEQILSQAQNFESRKLIYRALAATASDTAVEILRKRLKTTPSQAESTAIQQAIEHAYR